MTKEEIWEKLATEVKLRGFSPQTYHTYKCNINGFLDWAGKPYEELDEEDFRNYLIFLINEGRIEKSTINSRNGAIRFFPGRHSGEEHQLHAHSSTARRYKSSDCMEQRDS